MAKATARWRALTVGAAGIVLAAAAAVAIPALASNPPPSAMRLHMNTDGQYFAYGDQTQSLATSSCKITSPLGALAQLSNGGTKYPGLVSNGLGVKTGSSTAVFCGQTDISEALKIERGSSLGSRRFTGVRLDLEVSANAIVKLTLEQTSGAKTKATYELQTGNNVSSSQKVPSENFDTTIPYEVSSIGSETLDGCAAYGSLSPNTSKSDNCLWTVMPSFQFDKVTLTVSTGWVSLEGGSDFGTGSGSANDSLFYLSNSPPTATDNSYTTDEDVAVSGNVLTDGTPDSDPDGNPLTASLVGPGPSPASGDLSFTGTGAFTFTPALNFFGPVTFTYKVSDGLADSGVATVTISVAPVNDAPVDASADVTYEEDEGSVLVHMADDVDGDELHVVGECEFFDEAGDPVADVDYEDNGDGSITVTPPANFDGDLTVECTISDGSLSTTPIAEIVVTFTPVNDPPVAEDDEAEVGAGGTVEIHVLENDSDPDDPLSIVDFGNEAGESDQGGTLTEADGVITYAPPAGFGGLDSFTYTVSDGEFSDTATVVIDVFSGMCTGFPEPLPEGSEEGFVGTFTLLTELPPCKRFTLETSDGTIIFVPEGDADVAFRGEISFGPETPPGGGAFPSQLLYDPDPTDGDDSTRPVPWCSAFAFDLDGQVALGTQLPPGDDTWCIADIDITGAGTSITATWQVYGEGDPRFTR